VWDSTAELRYLVLPMRPLGTEDWDEERLASIVTRDCRSPADYLNKSYFGPVEPEAHEPTFHAEWECSSP
jgi:hypothetical protein